MIALVLIPWAPLYQGEPLRIAVRAPDVASLWAAIGDALSAEADFWKTKPTKDDLNRALRSISIIPEPLESPADAFQPIGEIRPLRPVEDP